MKLLTILACLLLFLQSSAQEQDTKTLQENAKHFSQQRDYTKAVLSLTQAAQQDPDNAAVQKELATALYFQKDINKAVEIIKPLVEKKDADVYVYQLAGRIYREKKDIAEAEKLYKRGLKKFPGSGLLYNDYAELLWYRKDSNAIIQWQKGMEVDPNYTENYYNAARYYSNTGDKIWSLICGEIFINMENATMRTIEIKNILLENYKKLLKDSAVMNTQNSRNPFVIAYLSTLSRQSPIVSTGINAHSLAMLRTRFILDWYDKNALKFPLRLFEYHRQLLKAGLFEAYNQWLFGPVQNLTAFQNWTNKNSETYTEFISFQNEHILKLPIGQNYQNRNQ